MITVNMDIFTKDEMYLTAKKNFSTKTLLSHKLCMQNGK